MATAISNDNSVILICSFISFMTHGILERLVKVAHFLLVNKLNYENFLTKELSEQELQQCSFNNYYKLLYMLTV